MAFPSLRPSSGGKGSRPPRAVGLPACPVRLHGRSRLPGPQSVRPVFLVRRPPARARQPGSLHAHRRAGGPGVVAQLQRPCPDRAGPPGRAGQPGHPSRDGPPGAKPGAARRHRCRPVSDGQRQRVLHAGKAQRQGCDQPDRRRWRRWRGRRGRRERRCWRRHAGHRVQRPGRHPRRHPQHHAHPRLRPVPGRLRRELGTRPVGPRPPRGRERGRQPASQPGGAPGRAAVHHRGGRPRLHAAPRHAGHAPHHPRQPEVRRGERLPDRGARPRRPGDRPGRGQRPRPGGKHRRRHPAIGAAGGADHQRHRPAARPAAVHPAGRAVRRRRREVRRPARAAPRARSGCRPSWPGGGPTSARPRRSFMPPPPPSAWRRPTSTRA